MSELTFSSLELSAPLLAALADVGYETPSPIQQACIPPLLAGHDLLGEAQTGTGKTAAFALPFLQRLDLKLMQPQVLVLTPTRELAIQVAEAFQSYARHLPGFHVLPVYGGQGMGLQLRSLKRGVHVIVGTPGRVMDHLERKSLVLDQLTGLVLDEADEMLRMGFIDDVQWILEHTQATRQTALFSATMSETIRRVARTHMREPLEVKIKSATRTVAAVRQRYWQVTGTNKLDALTRILEVEDELDAALVFVRTKTATVELADRLEARGYSAAALNGDMNQPLRERVIEQLKSGALDIVVATDVAARGIDVGRISHVINYDIPYDSEAYVHRIGRTGRAGRAGNAILFVAPREFRMLRTIERVTRQPIEPLTLPSRALVADRRVAQFRKQVAEVLTSEPMEFFAEVVAQLEQEHEGNLAGVAAALLCMAQRAKPLRLQDKESYSSEDSESHERAPARAVRDDRGPRDSRSTRAPREDRESREPRERKVRAAPAIEPRGALKPFRIAVGRDHEASPREIVGAIANEAGLASRFIGRIELFDQYSTVELPEDLPAAVLDVLRKTRVKQRALEIRPMAAGDAEQQPERGKSERKRPPRRDRDERTGHQPPRKVTHESSPKRPDSPARRPKRDKP